MLPAQSSQSTGDNHAPTEPQEHYSVAPARYPLTATQKGIFADSLVAADKGVNIEQVVWQFEQVPDMVCLEHAWQEALGAFDALRLRFHWPESAEPWQEVVDSVRMPFRVVDWTAIASGQSFNIERVLAEDRRAGFDLFRVPLCRVTVILIGRTQAICIWTVHHTIIDGGSFAPVLEYVRARIEQRVAPSPYQGQFTRFLTWLQQQQFEPGVEFYTRLLKGVEEPTPLPLHTDCASVAHGSTATFYAEVARATTKQLFEQARREHVSLNTIVQLAWAILLARYTCSADVLFGTTWSGRPGTFEDAKDTVGPCINTLPIRVGLPPDGTLRTALLALREQHLKSRPFHHTPVHLIKAASGLAHVAHLFGTIVVFEYERFNSALKRRDARWHRDQLWSRSQPNYALTLAVSVSDDQLEVELEYDIALYDRARVAQLAADYVRVLEALTGSIEQRPATVRLHDPQVYDNLTVIEAQRETVPGQPCPVYTILHNATQRGDAVAIHDMDGNTISYAELVARVADLASCLTLRGVTDGSLVAVLIPRSIAAVVALLAIQTAGGIYVPLDPSSPRERTKFLLADCEACLVLVNSDTRAHPTLPSEGIFNVDDLVGAQVGERLGVNDNVASWCKAEASASAYIIYTSGSTGEPKGVVVPHAALANHMDAVTDRFGLTQRDRVLQFSSLSFDVSLEEILPTLAVGATLYLRSPQMTASARNFFQAIIRFEITVANLPTAFWHQLVCSELAWPTSLRLLIIGGERANPEVHRAFRKADTRHIRLLNGYGPTETTITSTCYDDTEGPGETELPLGRPLPGVSHFVLDRQLEPVPVGATGELFIGGAGLALGYLNRETTTAQRFLPHPWRAGARLYATGDRVRLAPGGHYVFVDRFDNQIKLHGYRVELGEIEARLRAHPFVRDAVAVLYRREASEPSLVAFVQTIPRKTTGELLKEHVAAALPRYMVPSRVMLLDNFPINSSGKVDRRALASIPLADPAEDEPIPSLTDPLLHSLLQIWSDVLDKPVYDTSQSFFALGGTSLLVVKLFSLIEKRLGRSCNATAFFRNPTVSALAELLRESKDADWKAPVVQLASGKPHIRPLFFAPGVVGQGLDFVHLAKVLHSDVPLFALQMRGLSLIDTPHDSLRAAAADYADRIQAIQLTGPYGISGYSAGGIVAVAIAQELHRRGERTDFVALIDSVPPSTIRIPSPFSSPRRAFRMLRSLRRRIEDAIAAQLTFEQFAKRCVGALRRVASRWSPLAAPHIPSIDEVLANAATELAPAHHKLIEDHLQMIQHHQFERMPIDIVLLRTELDPFEGPHEAELGWQRVTSGQIRIEYLSLPHMELLTPEGAPEVADIIQRYLLVRRVYEPSQ